jgi:hypothetical protein
MTQELDYIAKNKPMVSTGVKTKSTPPTETTTNYSIIMNPMVTWINLG